MISVARHSACDSRRNQIISRFGSDQSGLKTYRFNSFGFRGEEPRPSAKLRLLVCGCSHTFGTGLAEHETWSEAFRRALADANGLAPSDVNLLNFADGGASNDYIARTTLSQLEAVRPDAVAIMFTHRNRAEHYDGEEVRAIGPWILMQTALSGSADVGAYQELSKAYYEWYSDDVGTIQTLRNMLLIQECCRARGIPGIYACIERDVITTTAKTCNSARGLQALLDTNRFVVIDLKAADVRIDTAADGRHLGPQSHQRIGRHLFDVFSRAATNA